MESVSAGASTRTTDRTPRMQPPVLTPPFRFATVEAGLFRGAYPTLNNFRFLRRLQLRTIVSLIPARPTADLAEFCREEHIDNVVYRAKRYRENAEAMSHEQVALMLETLLEPANLPAFVHCLDGRNVAGALFMCLRKLQGWQASSYIDEFSRYLVEEPERYEIKYVDTFVQPINVPPVIPPWLWGGVLPVGCKHPSIPLILPTDDTEEGQDGDGNEYEQDSATAKELQRLYYRGTAYVDTLMVPQDVLELYTDGEEDMVQLQRQRAQRQEQERRTLRRRALNLIASADRDVPEEDDSTLGNDFSVRLQALALEGMTMNVDIAYGMQSLHVNFGFW